MKNKLLLAGIVTLCLAACTKQEKAEFKSGAVQSDDFTATITEEQTKTSLGASNSVLWTADDQISIFTRTAHNRRYKLTSGAASTNGTFSYQGYTGTNATVITENYAIYPYDAAAEMTPSNKTIVTKIASEQTYAADSFYNNTALMAAKSESGNTNLGFKNIEGLLCINLSSNSNLPSTDLYKIKSIKIQSAANYLAGDVRVDMSTSDYTAAVIANANAKRSVTLKCSSPVDVGHAIVPFYIALPATAFAASDAEIVITFSDNSYLTRTVSSAFPIVKNSIYTLSHVFNADDFNGTTYGYTRFVQSGNAVSELSQVLTNATGTVSLAVANQSTTGETQPVSDDLTFTIPATTSAQNIVLALPEGVEEGNSVSIGTSEAPSTYSGTIEIEVPESKNVPTLNINAPNATVKLNGVIVSATISSSEHTCVVEKDAVIDVLTVNAGKVEIYGKVNSLVLNGDAYLNEEHPGNLVAKIEGTKQYYTSLRAAVAAVEENQTIKLLSDCVGDGVQVPSNKNFIIDFNGKTYDINANTVGSTGTVTNGFQLLKGSTLEFKNGTIKSDFAKILIQNYSNLTLNDMVLDGRNLKISVSGNYTLSNNCGTTNITGNTSIYARQGHYAFDVFYWKASYPEGLTVNVNTTGTIDGLVEYTLYGVTDNYSDALGKGILNIQNGNFTKEIKVTGIQSGYKANISISGGTFSEDPSKYLAAGHSSIYNEGLHRWEIDQNIAKIGSTNYTSLQDAVDAVPTTNAETTIELLGNAAGGGVKVIAGKNVIFDLKGYTYTQVHTRVGSTGTQTQAFQLLRGSTVRFKDGTLKSTFSKRFIQNYCDLTLENATIDVRQRPTMVGDPADYYAICHNNGALSLTGSSSILLKDGESAFHLDHWLEGGYTDGINVTINTTGTVDGKMEFGCTTNTGLPADINEKAVLVIDNGNFTHYSMYIFGGITNPNITINRGTFDADPAPYVADGKSVTQSGGIYTVR